MATKKKKKRQKRDKKLVRAAQWLRRAFEKRKMGALAQVLEYFPNLKEHWGELLYEQKSVEEAKVKPTREGMRETQRLLRRLRGRVNNLKSCAHHILQRIDSCSTGLADQEDVTIDAVGLPSLSDCYKQLEGLAREFGSCKLNDEQRTLVVPSHEVQLGSVLFGRYNISLSLDDIGADNRSFYRIEPVSSECPWIDASAHPHLNGGRLCEGDGDGAMTKAFDDGRLFDCVMLINSILQTYGNSPYVDLERFERATGNSSGHEYFCGACECGLDEDQVFECEACREYRCRSCISQCSVTDLWICTGCREQAMADGVVCVSNCRGIGGSNCSVRQNEPCPGCNHIIPDQMIAKCDIVQDEAQLCINCAQSWAESQEACDSCLMHGYLGCALVKYGYPVLDTLNHPANVDARGRQHRHHTFGWHPTRLFHKGQIGGDDLSDFRAYQDRLRQPGWRDSRRRNVHTMTHAQRATLIEIEV